jgi:hypothetical protein
MKSITPLNFHRTINGNDSNTMKILLVAPSVSLNTIPEIRSITSQHNATVLNGPVTAEDVYDAVNDQEYDIIHFATHQEGSNEMLDKIMLSNGDSLDLASLARVAKISKCKLVILSLCQGSRIAIYLINQKIPNVLFATVDIPDKKAWELMSAFYVELKRYKVNNRIINYQDIFKNIDNGDGTYGLLVSMEHTEVLTELNTNIEKLTKRVDLIDIHIFNQPASVFALYPKVTKLFIFAIMIQSLANLYVMLFR